MDANTIIVERPLIGGESITAQPNLWRVLTPFSGYRVAQWLLWSYGGNWDAHQLCGVIVGQPYKATHFAHGNAAYSYSGTAWSRVATKGMHFLSHAAITPNSALTWTADRAYKYVLVACDYWATFTDPTIALVGSGTLLRSTLNQHTTTSIWSGSTAPTEGGTGESPTSYNPRYVVLATNVAAGDTITFTSADGGTTRICPIIGVWDTKCTSPTDEHVFLCPPFLHWSESAYYDPTLIYVWPGISSSGITGAPRIRATADGAADFFLTPQHTTATRALRKIGGGDLVPVLTKFDADNLNGAAFAPSINTRTLLTGGAFVISHEGELTWNSNVIASYRETQQINASGAQWAWTVRFLAQAVTDGVQLSSGGYLGMFTMNGQAGRCWWPGCGSPVVLDDDDDSLVGYYSDRALLYGGRMADAVLEFVGRQGDGKLGTDSVGATKLNIQQRTNGQDKFYHTYWPGALKEVAVVEDDALIGGAAVSVIPLSDTRRLLPIRADGLRSAPP